MSKKQLKTLSIKAVWARRVIAFPKATSPVAVLVIIISDARIAFVDDNGLPLSLKNVTPTTRVTTEGTNFIFKLRNANICGIGTLTMSGHSILSVGRFDDNNRNVRTAEPMIASNYWHVAMSSIDARTVSVAVTMIASYYWHVAMSSIDARTVSVAVTMIVAPPRFCTKPRIAGGVAWTNERFYGSSERVAGTGKGIVCILSGITEEDKVNILPGIVHAVYVVARVVDRASCSIH